MIGFYPNAQDCQSESFPASSSHVSHPPSPQLHPLGSGSLPRRRIRSPLSRSREWRPIPFKKIRPRHHHSRPPPPAHLRICHHLQRKMDRRESRIWTRRFSLCSEKCHPRSPLRRKRSHQRHLVRWTPHRRERLPHRPHSQLHPFRNLSFRNRLKNNFHPPILRPPLGRGVRCHRMAIPVTHRR